MKHIKKQKYSLSQLNRSSLKKHKPCFILLTGFSGAGKSTIANLLEQELHKQGIHTYSLDGDNLRGGLNNDLAFTKEDRNENLRRVAEVAKLFIDAGIVVIAAFISPYKKVRENIKNIIGNEFYVEVYINTALEICESRDAKGLYKKARANEIENFTGISSPYEVPENPTIEIITAKESNTQAVKKIISVLKNKL